MKFNHWAEFLSPYQNVTNFSKPKVYGAQNVENYVLLIELLQSLFSYFAVCTGKIAARLMSKYKLSIRLT